MSVQDDAQAAVEAAQKVRDELASTQPVPASVTGVTVHVTGVTVHYSDGSSADFGPPTVAEPETETSSPASETGSTDSPASHEVSGTTPEAA